MTDVVDCPPALAARPRDDRGNVVSYVSAWKDGRPLLGTNDARKCAEVILNRWCGQCGTPLGYWIAFLGDDESVGLRTFLEPPMHPECARYAIAVCPYLASPRYVGRRQIEGVIAVADRARPATMLLYFTRSYEPAYNADVPTCRAAPAKQLERF